MFDYSECCIIIVTSEEMKEHIKNKHTIKSASQISSVIENIIYTVIDLSETEHDSSEDDGGSDKEDKDINIENDFSYEEGSSAEAYKGKLNFICTGSQGINKQGKAISANLLHVRSGV